MDWERNAQLSAGTLHCDCILNNVLGAEMIAGISDASCALYLQRKTIVRYDTMICLFLDVGRAELSGLSHASCAFLYLAAEKRVKVIHNALKIKFKRKEQHAPLKAAALRHSILQCCTRCVLLDIKTSMTVVEFSFSKQLLADNKWNINMPRVYLYYRFDHWYCDQYCCFVNI